MIDVVCLNPSMDRTLVVDSLIPGEVHRAKECHITPGGKGINVARFIKQIRPQKGVRVYGLAGGVIGDYVRKTLMDDGIVDAMTPIRGETRICSIIVSGGESTVINESGPHVFEAEVEEFLSSLRDDATLAVVSGSAPEGVEADIYRAVIRHYHRHRIPVYLDTTGRLLSEALKERPTLLKINQDEFLRFLDGSANRGNSITVNPGNPVHRDGDSMESLDVAAERARRQHQLAHLIVTMGSQGAMVATEARDPTWFGPLKIHTVNPTASGDAFLAGLVDGVLQEGDIHTAVSFAMSAAALNAVSLTSNLSDVSLYEPWARSVTSETFKR